WTSASGRVSDRQSGLGPTVGRTPASSRPRASTGARRPTTWRTRRPPHPEARRLPGRRPASPRTT
ncbi:MAG: hypothetical protein AVDCRST_MAG49-3697, partial [uncultured Thermomicrobiales bacterium]